MTRLFSVNFLIFCLFFAYNVSCGSATNFTETPVVRINTGQVRGRRVTANEYGTVDFYEGIRYGKAARFERPTFADSWDGVVNATHFNFACPQPGIAVSDHLAPTDPLKTLQSNEDCLFLNLWRATSALSEDSKRAVMVYFYGGTFKTGTIFQELMDGRYMAVLGNVIVVAVSYRGGSFGFLYGGSTNHTGNMGLYDMKLSLEWIQTNIHHFGGDPNKVTIFGQSAGSMSIGALILSPLTKRLFQRAIMQSGAPNSYLAVNSIAKIEENQKSIAKTTGCPPKSSELLECLKKMTTQEVLAKTNAETFSDEVLGPVYGTEFLPKHPVEMLKEGKLNQVDLMFGTVDNEGSIFVERIHPMLNPRNDGHEMTVKNSRTLIKFICQLTKGVACEEVADFYSGRMNVTDKNQMRHMVAEAFGDYHITCPTILFGREAQKHLGAHKTYSYRFMARIEADFVKACSGWASPCHGSEAVYMLGLPIRVPVMFTREDQQLSIDMIEAWTNFAKTGSPQKMGAVAWEEQHLDSETNTMLLDKHGYRMEKFYARTCDTFWKTKLGF